MMKKEVCCKSIDFSAIDNLIVLIKEDKDKSFFNNLDFTALILLKELFKEGKLKED